MRKIGLGLIIAYQRLFAWLPPSCRYTRADAVTYQAIERYAPLRGRGWVSAASAAVNPMHPGG